jgi:FtsH-binding integral membrane protein
MAVPPPRIPEGEWLHERTSHHTGLCGLRHLAEERNRVLRNTYWLLALSLMPTVLGAWLGVATGITARCAAGWA